MYYYSITGILRWTCPLSEVYLIYTVFRQLDLLPYSGDWLTLKVKSKRLGLSIVILVI